MSFRTITKGAVTAAALTAAALIPAGPANAQEPLPGSAHFEDTQVEVFPGCAGPLGAEAMTSKIQNGNNPVEVAIAVSLRFETGNPDPACAVTSHITWRNLDTGAQGATDITVPGYSEPSKMGTAGFARDNLPTGPGRIVVTASSNPNPAEVEVQAY